MKQFTNSNPRSISEAKRDIQQASRAGRTFAFAGGGSDLLGLMKERIFTPDVVVNLKSISGLDQIEITDGGVKIGGMTTLAALSRHPEIIDRYRVLSQAAESVATLQIRTAGTLAGNICQRPWCWYFRNGFPCFKAGGKTCFSISGENQLHAIFGGGPSFIVHPSDTAPALVALGARIRIVGSASERMVSAADFFTLPRHNAAKENVLQDDEFVASIELPREEPGTRSTYTKILDREAWTHAVVSVAAVLEMDGDICNSARIVLGGVAPIPWRVEASERLVSGRRLTHGLAANAAKAAVAEANPLARNRYKVALVEQVVKRTLLALATRI
jgi:xanthine dehydrogenase YagS FAD-binding subunit